MTALADRRLIRRAFVRSHFLQAGWSFEGMQALGLAYSLEPFLGGGKALIRHLSYFNTQPHMAGFVIGAVGALERVSADERRIETLKRGLGASLAGIGDPLVWGALRPAAAALALLAGVLLERPGWAHFKGAWLAAATLFLVAFNIPATALRWRGLRTGFALGEGVVREIKRVHWRILIRELRWTGLVMTAALATIMTYDAWRAGTGAAALAGMGLAGGLGLKAAGASLPQAYGVLLAAGLMMVAAGWGI